VWTPQAQAELLREAMKQLGVSRAAVLGHSWGASVAVALALEHPELVSGMVLASGYYYPSLRADVLALSSPAVPLFGDIIRYAIAPIVSRLMWPLTLRKMFDPAPVPHKFAKGFPEEMAFRPSQIRASAAESALMIPDALAESARYQELKMPLVIIAGAADRLVDTASQSGRLNRELAHSVFHCIPGAGHMVHQTATEKVMDAIHEVMKAEPERSPSAMTLRSAA
jgi:pimeloyl-ACP methyl ester carboxylesterase